MKRNNKMVLIVVLGFIAIALLVTGLFVFRNMIDEKNDKMGKKNGSRPMFYTDAGKDVEFAISPINSEMEVGSTIASQDALVNISLQNNYDATSVCTYDLFWEWNDTTAGYYKTKTDHKELTISGEIDDINLFEDVQINDYNLANPRTFLASYFVMNEGNGITPLFLKANLKLYKLAENQETHSDNTYVGKVVIDNVSCNAATKLKDKNLNDNNYVCLSHTNSPYCEEDSLYQVLEVTSKGIKVVKAKEYGTTAWSDTFLNDGLENFIKNNLKAFQKTVLDYSWPIVKYPRNDLTFEEALEIEEKAENKVISKVGLLSYSDVLKYSFLKDYETPYLLLGGGTYTNKGFNQDNKIGLIYPCLYLDIDVVTSRGNGTISSPYYIN